jgi:ATP-dependent DNA helicase RecQ
VEEITAVYKLMVLVPYHHAGLDAKTRAKHQDMFFNGRWRMLLLQLLHSDRIDKPDVRFVIHHDIPNL